MKNKSNSIIYLTATLGLILASNVQADDDDVAEIQATSQAAGLISLQEASEKALQAKPGTIVETDLDRRMWPLAGWDYEFDIVDAQGLKWEVEVDGKTGESRRIMRDYF